MRRREKRERERAKKRDRETKTDRATLTDRGVKREKMAEYIYIYIDLYSILTWRISGGEGRRITDRGVKRERERMAE